MALQLFEHNQKAYEAAVRMMQMCGKAAVIHPTGTGKSWIAFKLIEDHPDAVVLWLSPSEYIFRTQLENLRKQAPEFYLENVHFYTYAKLMFCKPEDMAEIAALRPEYIILDEFHRVGAECWGASTLELLKLCPDAKILGLSATNVRYLDNNRDMAEELFDGRIAAEMTLGEAIVRGILPAPKYVTTVYKYQKELARWQARVDEVRSPGIQERNQKYLDALRRALENAEGLNWVFERNIAQKSGKYIVFCAGREHMEEMASHVPEWFSGVNPEVHVYKAASDDPAVSREFEAFRADRSNTLKLLFCIDMLNEGVHVEGIAGVILFRPTVSPIIYKQQIGRALTAGDNETPLILDIVNNFEGLNSIAGLSSEMETAVHRLYANGEAEKIVTERFEIVEQVRDCRLLFEQLQASLSSTWEHYFSEASIYYAEHGDLKVPVQYTTPAGLSLGSWVQVQRLVRKGKRAGSLSLQQIERLDGIGMVWEDRTEAAWNRAYAKAKQYYETHGDLLVPFQYKDETGFALGQWVSVRRQKYLDGELTREQIRKLEEIGMVWSVVSANWERAYAEAVAYYVKNGDLEVPAKYASDSGVNLGAWLSSQKRLHQQGRLTAEQTARLDAIGMNWGNRNDQKWLEYYSAAKRYFRLHGNLDVPSNYVSEEGLKLGTWVVRMRYTCHKPGATRTKLTPERRRMLEQIGVR